MFEHLFDLMLVSEEYDRLDYKIKISLQKKKRLGARKWGKKTRTKLTNRRKE